MPDEDEETSNLQHLMPPPDDGHEEAETIKSSKPIDRWLALGGLALGVILYLLSRTPLIVIFGCLLVFVFLIHPVWNFWWIENKRHRQIIATLLLAILVLLLGYAAWPLPQTATVPIAANSTALPSATSDSIHVIANIGTISMSNRQPNEIGMFDVIGGHSITPIDIMAYVTVANLQNISLKIQSFWWGDKSIRLRPVSLIGAQLYALISNAGQASKAQPLSVDSFLQTELMTQTIEPHKSISGWTFWECPSGWCFPGRSFSVEDTEGNVFTVTPELNQPSQSLGTMPTDLRVTGPPVPFSSFGKLNIEQCAGH